MFDDGYRAMKLAQIDLNFKDFLAQLPRLMEDHAGRYALMRDGKIASFHATALDAQITGNLTFHDGRFSFQEVTDEVIELGSWAYAVSPGPA